jgi:hypothetical protein
MDLLLSQLLKEEDNWLVNKTFISKKKVCPKLILSLK